ncbi:hypothetical protein [Pantoea rwandensis]|uniref:Uncharacterized protein n=1 Tax=Pantoea rwandensis TaxID=1076550 RepID=A0A1X1D177_9GAMM|nr:hypothetical protein [Pantoea rwandensis]ORM70423.1 hypothetical protein HA51_06490 [Pantoea rwandensis]
MPVNPTISALIKLPPLGLFFCGVLLALISVFGRWWVITSQYAQCSFPLTFYDIKSEREWILIKGVYRSYRDGVHSGHMSYLGTLSHFVEGERIAPITPIHRAVWFSGLSHHNLLKLYVTHHSRGLGDRSSDDVVQEYVFPHLRVGDVSVIALFLLNGKVLATGTESVMRNICIR